MAELIQNGSAKKDTDAARQVAPDAEGPTSLRSKVARLVREYRKRERWLMFQVTSRSTKPPDWASAIASVVEQQHRFAHLVNQHERRHKETQRLVAAITQPLTLRGGFL